MGATDGLSGVAGYSYVWDTSPGTLPDTVEEGSGHDDHESGPGRWE